MDITMSKYHFDKLQEAAIQEKERKRVLDEVRKLFTKWQSEDEVFSFLYELTKLERGEE